MATADVSIRGDLSAILEDIADLSAAIDLLDRVPDRLRHDISALLANLRDDIAVVDCPAASSAGELVLRFQFVPGGRFEAIVAAVRALRPDFVHGGSLP